MKFLALFFKKITLHDSLSACMNISACMQLIIGPKEVQMRGIG